VARILEIATTNDFACCDIWILIETFAIKPFNVKGFYTAHSLARKQARRGRPTGGVSVLSSPKIGPLAIAHKSEDTLALSSLHLNIIAIYVRPQEQPADFILRLLQAASKLNLRLPTIIAGDFNCRLDLSPLQMRTTALIRTLHEEGFWIANDPETKTYIASNGSSTIDLIATNLPRNQISRIVCLPNSVLSALKKHKPMHAQIEIDSVMPNSQMRRSMPVALDQTKLASILPDIMSAFERAECIDEQAKVINKALEFTTRQGAKSKRVSKPWFDSECHCAKTLVLQRLKDFRRNPELRFEYTQAQRVYKDLIKSKLHEWQRLAEIRMVQEAEEKPYKYRKDADKSINCPIPSDEIRAHFISLAQAENSLPKTEPPLHIALTREQSDQQIELNRDFSHEEVQTRINALKNHKAAGPDGVKTEHVKGGIQLWGLWIALFNICLSIGSIPREWKTCLLVVIPKGKGDPSNPSSWRGISKKCVAGKLLSSLVATRLYEYLDRCHLLPPCQHGFLRGLSTETAVNQLLGFIKERLSKPKRPLYVCFVDFKAAFDSASRSSVISSLANLGITGRILRLIMSMLGENGVVIQDGLSELPEFTQTTGLPQGDNISSILFVILLHEIPTMLSNLINTVKTILYADDIAITAHSLGELKKSLEALICHTERKGLRINWSKTKIMKFRRGGRLAASDKLIIADQEIEFVQRFSYLGFELTATATSFSAHIQERKRKAICSIVSIPDLRRISMATALKLFALKVAPVASYGIRTIWQDLKISDLEDLESIKANFLKRAMGLSKFTQNRLTYMMARTSTFIEDLRGIYGLEETAASLEFKRRLDLKVAEINPEFSSSSAMTDISWMSSLYDLRHLICRAAVHGFHHKYCEDTSYHQPAGNCRCKFCGTLCTIYHLNQCTQSPFASLSDHDQLSQEAP
jgi:hypothetical protein